MKVEIKEEPVVADIRGMAQGIYTDVSKKHLFIKWNGMICCLSDEYIRIDANHAFSFQVIPFRGQVTITV